MNKLVESLQTRIAQLEKENIELKRDNRRYENGRVILMGMIDRLTEQLKAASRSRSSAAESSPSSS